TRSLPRMVRGQTPTDAAGANLAHILRQTMDDAAPRSLYSIPVTPPSVLGSSGNRIASINIDPAFGARPTFGALPSGLALHHEPEYVIRILDENGRHVRTISRSIRPRKVTRKDQERWEENRKRGEAAGVRGGGVIVMSRTSVGSGGGGAPPAAPVALSLENVPFADVMSVITAIRTDPPGRIWVKRRAADGTATGPVDIVTDTGRYIGTLPAQPLPDAVSTSGLAAWVVTDDELDVERVVVRRLPATWR